MPNKDKVKRKEYNKKYCEDNKQRLAVQRKIYNEKNKKYRKEYNEKNKEIMKAKRKKYYEENKEAISIKTKEWINNNKEKNNIRDKEYKKKNKEKLAKKRKEYYKENKEVLIQKSKDYYRTPAGKMKSYKHDAKRRGHVFDLTLDIFNEIINKKCTYCDEDKSGGIDRSDNNIGYTIDNSVPCCTQCNTMKLNYTLEEFENKIFKIYKNLKNKGNS